MNRSPLPPGNGYEILGETVTGRTLTFGAGTRVDVVARGARLVDCELRILRTGRAFPVLDATLIDCDIRPRRPLRNQQFNHTRFERCTFRGSYLGCRFGNFLSDTHASIASCDFAGAQLDLTDFYDCDVHALQLPDWPHVYLLWDGVADWRQNWLALPFPPELRVTARVLVEYPRPRSFVSLYLPSRGLDPESVWPLIQDFEPVWFPGKAAKPRVRQALVTAIGGENDVREHRRQATLRRTAIWNHLHNGWLLDIQEAAQGVWRAIVDSSFLQKRVAGAPARLTIELTGCGRMTILKQGSVQALGPDVGRFMIMSATDSPDGVIVKGHRRERGWLVLEYTDYRLLSSEGMPISDAALEAMVAQYWGA